MKKYIIQDKEAGNVIDSFDSLENAKTALGYYVAQDILNDVFQPEFYEIKEEYGFEVITFDDENDSNEQVVEGDLLWKDALIMAEKIHSEGKFYGVEIVDTDPDNMESIVWVKTKI